MPIIAVFLILLLLSWQTVTSYSPIYVQGLDLNSSNILEIIKKYSNISPKIDKRILDVLDENKISSINPHIPLSESNDKLAVYVIFDPLHVEEIYSEINVIAQNENIVVSKLSLAEMERLTELEYVQRITLPDLTEQISYSENSIEVNPLKHTTSEVVSTFANLMHQKGITGSGVKVAILGTSFVVSDPEIANNVAFSFLFDSGGVCFGDKNCGTPAGSSSGTAVAEIIVDMAPDVELYLYTIPNNVDFADAIDDAIIRNVDIISLSIVYRTAGGDGTTGLFRDGTSSVAKKVNEASDNGILVVATSGFSGTTHWQGSYAPSTTVFPDDLGLCCISISSESVMEFQPAAVGKQKACLPVTDNGTEFMLAWDDWVLSSNDYDLYLFSSNMETELASSIDAQSNDEPIESFTNNSPVGSACLVVASFDSTENHSFHIDSKNNPIDASFRVRDGSIATPGDAVGALTVGDVNRISNTLSSYSSSGPTDDGRLKPEICGLSQVSVHQSSINPLFRSAPTPHVTGAAALLLQQNPTLTVEDLRQKLISEASPNASYSQDNLCGSNSGVVSLETASTLCPLLPTSSGDWNVGFDCELTEKTIAPGKVIIQSDSVLTIPSGQELNVDFANNNLQIKSGSGVLIKSGGTLQSTKLGITSLSKTSAVPLELLTITGSGFDPDSDNLLVRFSDNAFSIDIPIVEATPTSVLVSVPPKIDLTTGKFDSGTVNVQLIQRSESGIVQSNIIGGFQILDIPTPSGPIGSVTLAFLQEQADLTRALRADNTNPFSSAEFNQDLDQSISNLDSLIAEIQLVVNDPNKTIDLGTLDDIPIVITSSTLEEMDKMVLALSLAQNENTPLRNLNSNQIPNVCAPTPEEATLKRLQIVSGALKVTGGLLGLAGLAMVVTASGPILVAGITVTAAGLAAAAIATGGITALYVIWENHKLEAIAVQNFNLALEEKARYVQMMTFPDFLFKFLLGKIPGVGPAFNVGDLIDGGSDVLQHVLSPPFFPLKVTASFGGTASCKLENGVTIDICDSVFPNGEQIVIEAKEDPDFVFVDWSGGCPSSANPCTIIHNRCAEITANFESILLLSVGKSGPGSGKIVCSGSNVPSACVGLNEIPLTSPPISVVLAAGADIGSTFTGWSDACSGTDLCIVIMDTNKSVNAEFDLKTFDITTNTLGTGSGTITCSGTGVPTNCNGQVSSGSVVTVSQSASAGSTFSGWGGDCSSFGTSLVCTLTMDSNKSVTATFDIISTGIFAVTFDPASSCIERGSTSVYDAVAFGTVTGPVGSELHLQEFTVPLISSVSTSCGSWTDTGTPDVDRRCVRQSGQPATSTWTDTFIVTDTQEIFSSFPVTMVVAVVDPNVSGAQDLIVTGTSEFPGFFCQ